MSDLKDGVREQIRELRASRDEGWFTTASAAVCHRLASQSVFQGAGSIAFYMALPGEVNADELMQSCLEQGLRVAVPRFSVETDKYAFSWVRSETEMVEGRFGCREPVMPDPVTDSLDLIIVPGVAFDGQCNRVGFGHGYYDRMLAHEAVSLSCRVALAFEFQMVPSIQTDKTDVGMDAIVTEERVILRV